MQRSMVSVGWVTVVVLALITIAAHAESTAIRGTNFHQHYKIERITIGKADKPAFGFYENKGVSIQEDGTQAEFVVVGTFDRVQDGTALQGYV
jgi:hypothetical protein